MMLKKEDKKDVFLTIIPALLSTILGTLPYFLFNKQTVEKYTYDIMIITIFIALSVGIFLISKKTKFSILLKLISFFIFFHFIFFPFIYVYLLNTNTNNIKIEKDVLNSEISNSYSNLDEIYGKSLSEKHKIIDDILKTEKKFLETKIDSIKLNQMFILNKYIIIYNYGYKFKERDPYVIFHLYNKKGIYISQIDDIKADFLNVNSVFKVALKETKNLQKLKTREIEQVKNNQFWSYKNVLPYSINIFYTSNLVPKSRISNVIYFIHNTFVFITLMSLIIGFLQSYISIKIKKE